MKDQLLTVIDALLLAKAELNTHSERRVKNAPRTLARLEAILMDPKVSAAMGTLAPGTADAPSLVPAQDDETVRVSRSCVQSARAVSKAGAS